MVKKISTGKLLLLIALLLGLVFFNQYMNSQNENTFREIFVQIDTASVYKITIYPKKQEEISLSRQGKSWMLRSGKLNTTADVEAIRGFLAGFTNLKSLSLAAQDKSGWASLQIDDTSGTRIKIMAGDKTFDMMLGKFAYNSSGRNGMSYIRHFNEKEVYAVEGYMALVMNEGSGMWRKKTFINGNPENWSSIAFTYPGDSSFILTKQGKSWMLNGMPADSSKTVQFVSSLANMPCSGFADNNSTTLDPLYTMTISGNNLSQAIVVSAYADNIEKLLLHSNLNADAYFSENKSHIADRIFVGKSQFLAQKK